MMRAWGATLVIASFLVSSTGAAMASDASTAASPAPVDSAAPLPSADEILARYMVAIGGRDKLKAVRSIRMRGTMTATGGFSAPYLLEMKRPSSVRTEFTYNAATAIQASDGTQGWVLVPGPGNAATAPVPMTPKQMEDLSQQADIDGPLVDPKAKGHTVELVGKETIGTVATWNLKLTDKAGIVRNFYLDSMTYFPIKQVVRKTVDGKESVAEMRLSDYREVSGLRFPYLLESSAKNLAGGQRLALDKIEINPEIAPERFKMPAAAAKSPEPPKPPAPKP